MNVCVDFTYIINANFTKKNMLLQFVSK